MASQQKVRITIPKDLSPDEREDLADDILEFIRRRTAKGLDWKNERFPRYSETYKKSLDFKIAGKSASKVNLELSGDMLAEMDLLTHKKGELVIGFQKGSETNGRVEGNRLGSYGGEPNPRKARDFLGIHPDDLDRILDHY